jgi:hypothetical protein
MVDNIAIFFFSSLIVYIVFRAVKLDRLLAWFSTEEQEVPLPPKKGIRK